MTIRARTNACHRPSLQESRAGGGGRTSWMSKPGGSPGRAGTVSGWVLGFAVTCVLAVMSLTAADDRRLVEAVKHHKMATIQALLAEGVDANVPEADGTTALHWAVHHDAADLVDRLLGAGARVTASNRYGIQPVSIASLNGSVVIVEVLSGCGRRSEHLPA